MPAGKKGSAMNTMKLKDRVAALEAEVAKLKEIVVNSKDETPWWKRIAGTFAGDPAFLEAMRLGREYRESLRPKPKRPRKKLHGGTGHRSHECSRMVTYSRIPTPLPALGPLT